MASIAPYPSREKKKKESTSNHANLSQCSFTLIGRSSKADKIPVHENQPDKTASHTSTVDSKVLLTVVTGFFLCFAHISVAALEHLPTSTCIGGAKYVKRSSETLDPGKKNQINTHLTCVQTALHLDYYYESSLLDSW